jgi:hypothetical protein
MATWYTDNLTGNDTTGDGTIANPYKSVLKAMQVGTGGDTVNVAGGSWVNIPGTLTYGGSTNSIATSQDLTGIVPVNSVIAIKDPVFGNRSIFLRVIAVSSIALTVNLGLSGNVVSGAQAERLDTNHYVATVANTDLESLSAITTNKQNFNIQGGWTNGFTAQDGVTVFINTSATTQSGTAFRTVNNLWLNGITFNNFAFVNLASSNAVLPSAPIGLQVNMGNLWFSFSGFFVGSLDYYHASTGCNISWATQSSSITLNQAFTYQTKTLVINNLWDWHVQTSGNVINSAAGALVKINNFWFKQVNAARGSSLLGVGTYDIDNFNIEWIQPTPESTLAYVILFDYQSPNSIVRNIVEYPTMSSASQKFIIFSNSLDAQIIAPSSNVDNWPLSTAAYSATLTKTSSFVYDSEGEKILFQNATTIFADPTVYDTGTNSLRIHRAFANVGSSEFVQVPIKNVYIPSGSNTPMTFTIRAQSPASAPTITVGIQPINMALSNGTTEAKGDLFYTENISLQPTWTNHTYTLTGSEVEALSGGYIKLCVNVISGWSQPYIWIDSVTVS